MNSGSDYTGRWGNSENRSIAEKLVRAISRGRLDNDHLLRYTGMTPSDCIDLRGLTFPRPISLKGEELRSLDFSYCNFRFAEFRKCTIENVRFRRIRVGDWRDRENVFQSVDFSGANLGVSAVGMDGSSYEEVDFSRADLHNTNFFRPVFRSCDFSYAQLRGVDFAASNFEKVKFEGELMDVWFNRTYRFPRDEGRYGVSKPNEMIQVDFRNVRLYGVTFTGGVDLSKVLLPEDGSLILIHRFHEALEGANQRLEDQGWKDQAIQSARSLIRSYQVHAKNQPMWILSRYEIEQLLGREYASDFINLVVANDVDS